MKKHINSNVIYLNTYDVKGSLKYYCIEQYGLKPVERDYLIIKNIKKILFNYARQYNTLSNKKINCYKLICSFTFN